MNWYYFSTKDQPAVLKLLGNVTREGEDKEYGVWLHLSSEQIARVEKELPTIEFTPDQVITICYDD